MHQVRERDNVGKGRVFDNDDKLADEGRNDEANGLGKHDLRLDLPSRQTNGEARLGLTARDSVNAGAEHLGENA